jgi:hypothetical protein
MFPAYYTFIAIFMWNKTNHMNNCYTNIHTQCTTINYIWNLFAQHSTTTVHHLYDTQSAVIVRNNAWERPKHAPCQDACTVLIP